MNQQCIMPGSVVYREKVTGTIMWPISTKNKSIHVTYGLNSVLETPDYTYTVISSSWNRWTCNGFN